MSAFISCSSSCIATTLSNNGNVYKEVDTMKKLTDEQLEELAREKQREYLREWRKKNPDKVKEYNQRYWRRRALREVKEQQEA